MDCEKDICKKIDVDGVIAGGKQFDLEITIPEDNRDVIFGVIKDCYKEPIKDAVVKLIEVDDKHGYKERKPVSHTFTDEDGEFVFGPLCPDRKYEINFWVDRVKHVKVCARCAHEGRCLKGVKMDKCDCFVEKKDCKEDFKCDCKCECKEEHKEDCKKDCKEECKCDCKEKCRPECKRDCKCDCFKKY